MKLTQEQEEKLQALNIKQRSAFQTLELPEKKVKGIKGQRGGLQSDKTEAEKQEYLRLKNRISNQVKGQLYVLSDTTARANAKRDDLQQKLGIAPPSNFDFIRVLFAHLSEFGAKEIDKSALLNPLNRINATAYNLPKAKFGRLMLRKEEKIATESFIADLSVYLEENSKLISSEKFRNFIALSSKDKHSILIDLALDLIDSGDISAETISYAVKYRRVPLDYYLASR